MIYFGAKGCFFFFFFLNNLVFVLAGIFVSFLFLLFKCFPGPSVPCLFLVLVKRVKVKVMDSTVDHKHSSVPVH